MVLVERLLIQATITPYSDISRMGGTLPILQNGIAQLGRAYKSVMGLIYLPA